MTGYNPLNSVKVNLELVGICQLDGMRFTDPNCPHGTPEQIAHCKAIDERMDNEDIFGHPIQADEWLSSRSFVRIPNDFNHARYGEQVAIVYGQSALPHDAELDGCGNDAHMYDFTPRQNMPIIDIDGIEEIPF